MDNILVGTLIDIQQPLVLITDPGKEHESILRLARVGYMKMFWLFSKWNSWMEKGLEVVKSIQPGA